MLRPLLHLNRFSKSIHSIHSIQLISTINKRFNSSIKNEKIDKRAYPIALSSLFMGTAIGIVIPIMPMFSTEIGINASQYGLVISVMGWTRLLFNIPADKYGRRPLLVGGPVLTAIGMAGTSIIHSMFGLTASRFLTGIGGSFQMAGAQTYLADISNSYNRARTMAPLQMGFSAGMAFGPFIGGLLADSLGFRPTFMVVGCAILCVSINNFIQCPETLKRKFLEDDENINSDKSLAKQLFDEFDNTLKQWKPLLLNYDIRQGIIGHTVFWFCTSGIMFTVMPLYAVNTLGMSSTQLGSSFAMLAIINLLGSQPIAYISDKYGRKPVLITSFTICGISSVLMTLVNNINELYIVLFLWSIGSTTFGSTPMAYISDLTNSSNRTQALGLLRSGGDIGLMFGSGFLGTLAHFTDLKISLGLGSFCFGFFGLRFALKAKETLVRRS